MADMTLTYLLLQVHTLSNLTSLYHLQELNLRGNPLLTIPDLCPMHTLTVPLSVDVTEVPIVCDGCVAWITFCTNVSLLNPVCAQPDSLTGVNVPSLTDYNILQGFCLGEYIATMCF